MSAGLFFVRARHERQRVAAAGRTRIAAIVAIVAIAGECVCGNPACANRCLGTASGEKRQVSRDQNSTVERADHARGRAHAVCATASRAASDAASRKRGMNASARSAGAHRGTPRPPRPRAARCGASRRPPVGFVGAPKRPFAALVRTCRICASVCRNSSAARGFFWQPCRHAMTAYFPAQRGDVAMDAPKVVVEGLCKVFGSNPRQALDLLAAGATKDEVFARTGQVVGVHNVSFDVREGEIFVLMGLSGSGKSTLIRLVNRLVEPSAGKVMIDGRDVAAVRRAELTALRRTDMSMVFQSFALMPQRTVLSNAAFGLEVAGMGRKDRERRAMDVLEQVGLAQFAHKLPAELSGGMQQRVGLARALAVNPSLMIMDEAFSALDPLKRKEMQNVLLQLQKEQRRTIMFVSHDLEEALRIGSRIAIMEGGRLVQVGTPQEIIANPADDYVRAFFEGIDTSRYLTAGDLMLTGAVPTLSKLDAKHVAASLNGSAEYAFVLDEARKIRGFVTRDALNGATPNVRQVESIPRDASLDHVVERCVAHPHALPVVDDDGCYCGSVDRAVLLKAITRSRGSHV
ncbi:quaternary amine ABC transporter ATP-binding protein [Burkholderia pseudomallei]|uniref:quaternary amine ABC transporter ATP-binding protein n=1 Tax=Burkholderia pseudomallei TaxID=28450 RepID=UPI0013E97A04|nr:glycine betaine/L-proline ABC transporter ATP-binding protein [Burkholderia pseudomallei]